MLQFRQSLKKKAAVKYVSKVEQKVMQEVNKPKESYSLNPMDEIFKGDRSIRKSDGITRGRKNECNTNEGE